MLNDTAVSGAKLKPIWLIPHLWTVKLENSSLTLKLAYINAFLLYSCFFDVLLFLTK